MLKSIDSYHMQFMVDLFLMYLLIKFQAMFSLIYLRDFMKSPRNADIERYQQK